MADGIKVSGPGVYSTPDGYTGRQAAMQIPADQYGAGKEMYQNQVDAPLAASEGRPVSMGNMGGGQTSASPTNFNEPNPNRDTPITAGADWGDGTDSTSLPIPPQAQDETAKLIMSLATLYPDPDLTRLSQRLKAEGRA
jgi:hypothetical protein